MSKEKLKVISFFKKMEKSRNAEYGIDFAKYYHMNQFFNLHEDLEHKVRSVRTTQWETSA